MEVIDVYPTGQQISLGTIGVTSSANSFQWFWYIYNTFATTFMNNNNLKNNNLNPYFATGFFDGEGYFNISVSRSTKMKTGWIVYLQFGVVLHKKDRLLLESIKTFLGNVGNITEGNQKVQYRVSSIKDLEVIIEHFDNFPLITQKWADYQLFKSAFELVKCKKHLTQEGLEKIVSIKASFNWGLSDDLKPAFPHVTPEARPLLQNQEIKDPNWLAGFASAEGNFFITFSSWERG
jgi:hypothetical protein